MAQQEPTAPFVGNEQNVVFALTETWDVGSLAWIKATGGGGGGGAVTIADGADVAEGSTADAAWVSGSGTVISLLKKIASPGGGGLTDTELRAAPVPVSGTVTVNNAAGAAAVNVQDGGNSITVDGAVTVSETSYITRLEEASAVITYVGEAVPATATSTAVWRVKRLDSTAGLVVLWAAGSAAFNQTWDGRAGYAYS